jgi:hypothetical protein
MCPYRSHLQEAVSLMPLRAWMFHVCMRFSVFVLSCVYVEALRRADHPSKESYGL